MREQAVSSVVGFVVVAAVAVTVRGHTVHTDQDHADREGQQQMNPPKAVRVSITRSHCFALSSQSTLVHCCLSV